SAQHRFDEFTTTVPPPCLLRQPRMICRRERLWPRDLNGYEMGVRSHLAQVHMQRPDGCDHRERVVSADRICAATTQVAFDQLRNQQSTVHTSPRRSHRIASPDAPVNFKSYRDSPTPLAIA